MAKWGKVDYREIEKLRDELEKFRKLEIDKFCRDMANELAQRLLRKVKQRTTVGQYKVMVYEKKDGTVLTYNEGKTGGDLRQAWTIGEVSYSGKTYVIDVINTEPYAMYYEYGHRQEVGRFVPQIGKRLKKGWSPGKFPLRNSVKEIQKAAPKLIEKKLYEKLKEVFENAT